MSAVSNCFHYFLCNPCITMCQEMLGLQAKQIWKHMRLTTMSYHTEVIWHCFFGLLVTIFNFERQKKQRNSGHPKNRLRVFCVFWLYITPKFKQKFGRRHTPSARPSLLMFRIGRPIARISTGSLAVVLSPCRRDRFRMDSYRVSMVRVTIFWDIKMRSPNQFDPSNL